MKELRALSRLIDSFLKLPSVGKKSAERMALAVLEMDEEDIQEFVYALTNIKNKIQKCEVCGLYSEEQKCEICQDQERDKKSIIVVSSFKDVYAFEKLKSYNGLYHVLGGALNATRGIGVNELNIESLLNRVHLDKIEEIILATNSTIEGETTALYIAKLLEKENINTTRLAYGLPMGGYVDYADSLTLKKALEGRRKI
ncbi:MAG: recombination mediator RecR [Bacilli bacterium]|jgi:recombination protein RecR|nr:recombination mediator RecR [Bacilli bacterium]NLN80354.1 recombination protein RecR [Erysipelotrichia bacterium]